MNIEEKIRKNAGAFDDVRMPAGSRERFMKELQRDTMRHAFTASNVRRMRVMTWTSVAAAAVTILMVISGMITDGKISTKSPQVADNKLVEMRQFYDERLDEAIINLENVS